MQAVILLYVVCIAVGFLGGSTGVGGVMLPPALVLLTDGTPHMAMGTSLAIIFFLTVMGTWMFWRLGHIQWKKAIPMTLGGFAGWPGAWAGSFMDAGPLVCVLSLVVIFAGAAALRPPKAMGNPHPFWQSCWGMLTIGGTTGFLAGLTGVGGGVLSVPWMVVVGYAPLTAVGLSQPYQVLVTSTGSIANISNGYVDFSIMPGLTIVSLLAFWWGVQWAKRMNPLLMRRAIGVVCMLLGVFMLVRELIS